MTLTIFGITSICKSRGTWYHSLCVPKYFNARIYKIKKSNKLLRWSILMEHIIEDSPNTTVHRLFMDQWCIASSVLPRQCVIIYKIDWYMHKLQKLFLSSLVQVNYMYTGYHNVYHMALTASVKFLSIRSFSIYFNATNIANLTGINLLRSQVLLSPTSRL